MATRPSQRGAGPGERAGRGGASRAPGSGSCSCLGLRAAGAGSLGRRSAGRKRSLGTACGVTGLAALPLVKRSSINTRGTGFRGKGLFVRHERFLPALGPALSAHGAGPGRAGRAAAAPPSHGPD